jgi:hypothetical protein
MLQTDETGNDGQAARTMMLMPMLARVKEDAENGEAYAASES